MDDDYYSENDQFVKRLIMLKLLFYSVLCKLTKDICGLDVNYFNYYDEHHFRYNVIALEMYQRMFLNLFLIVFMYKKGILGRDGN